MTATHCFPRLTALQLVRYITLKFNRGVLSGNAVTTTNSQPMHIAVAPLFTLWSDTSHLYRCTRAVPS